MGKAAQYVAPNGGFAFVWRGSNEYPSTVTESPDNQVLISNLIRVDLNTGQVKNMYDGRLTIMSGSRVFAGPYDGWALDTDHGYVVRWRGKQIETARTGELVFTDGCRVTLDEYAELAIAAPLGQGLIRLEAVYKTRYIGMKDTLRRSIRRGLQVPGARKSADGAWVLLRGEPTEWPPDTERYTRL